MGRTGKGGTPATRTRRDGYGNHRVVHFIRDRDANVHHVFFCST
jgi:hypothetical protein